MNMSLQTHQPIEGVYLCDQLDLPEIFGTAMSHLPGLRVLKPSEVTDPANVRFALAWRPSPDAFDAYPNIELVQVIAAGVDPVLKTPSLPHDAVVTRVHDPEQAAIMAGFAAWQVVWHHRNMGAYLDAASRADWTRVLIKTLRPPSQVTVGLLGFGYMGRAIAETVRTMGFPIVAATRSDGPAERGITRIAGPDAVTQVAAKSDILINVLPLTDDTRDILAAPLFAQMPKHAALIQLGRGEHLIEDDLLAALDNGHLSGASLDVFRQEPLPPEHPFWAHPKIVITPHEASVTSPSAVAHALAQSVREMTEGRHPTTAIDKKSGY
ncbi:glyoxylate/hydroxypyruvate reductase A [Marivita sp. S6314]|uniref:2-hydroxyacid dehydrogenase n=1 Tax=Marivita sp. S6314 TaxID=2926406 RepID=UPI001FF5996C|nr:glyoxylate/hydroxypyruvate reductase A [Marivita sp. S6314]MCK0150158.1 glyoxylate/hydroxypyruvate reductase A [Marivita sp. S6314]